MSQIPHKCPVCDGTGLVMRPPGVAGDQYLWTDNKTGPYTCRACGGGGIVWAPSFVQTFPVLEKPFLPVDPHEHCYPGRPCSTTCPVKGYEGT